ncbi:MAG: baeRF11 domain-containing protein [Protaetiibacter sp.]
MTTTRDRIALTAPTWDDVRRLAGVRTPWSVTIYAPASEWFRGEHPSIAASAEIRKIGHHLADAGAPPPSIDAIRSRLEHLAAHARSAEHSRVTRDDTAAVFVTVDAEHAFVLPRGPQRVRAIGDGFRVAPMIPAVSERTPAAFVLAASPNRVRLVDVAARPARVVSVPGLPQDLASLERLDLTGDRDTLAHLRTSEDPKLRLEQYARAIHAACTPQIAAADAVLMLAAAEPFASILRDTASEDVRLIGVLPGDHDRSDAQAIAAEAEPLMHAERAAVLDAEMVRLRELPDTAVLRDPKAARAATDAGAVQTLVLSTEWLLDRSGEPDEVDGLDAEGLVRSAFAHDSRIVCLSGVGDEVGELAAILRYPADF